MAEVVLVGRTDGATIPVADLGTGTPSASTFLRGDGTWATAGGSVAISSVSVAFTDGDTARRVTIADAAVSATSAILLSITRPTVTAEDDRGFLYTANVVSRGAGTFDVFLICSDISGNDPVESPPNETITLYYTVG